LVDCHDGHWRRDHGASIHAGGSQCHRRAGTPSANVDQPSPPSTSRTRRPSAWRFVGWDGAKDRHCQAGALLLDFDYFIDNTTHMSKDFWRWFRMNKDMFMKIVFGIRIMTHTSCARKTTLSVHEFLYQ
jgi:hypothetical protein